MRKKQIDLFNILKKIFICLTLCFAMFLIFNPSTVAFAGTSQTGSNPSGSGGNGSGNTGYTKIGIGGSDYGAQFNMVYFGGGLNNSTTNTTLRTTSDGSYYLETKVPGAEKMGINYQYIGKCTKGFAVGKCHNISKFPAQGYQDWWLTPKWYWIRWKWWDGSPYSSSGKMPGDLVKNGSFTKDKIYADGSGGEIKYKDLLDEVINAGFYFNNNKLVYQRGEERLDAAWIANTTVPKNDHHWSIYRVWIDGNLTFTREGESGESIYNNPTQTLEYTGDTGSNTNYNQKIEVQYVRVFKYWTEEVDGNGNTVKTYDTTYSNPTGHWNMERTIHYEAYNQSPTQTLFRPFDLNRNGLANESDVKSSYNDYVNGSTALDMSVNNYQNITDGTKIQTLDTNIGTRFNVTFNNDQFGIPTASEGGFNILSSNPGSSYSFGNNLYNRNVMNAIGYNGDWINTGKLSSPTYRLPEGVQTDYPYSQEIAGHKTKDVYWNVHLKGGVNSNNSSITWGDQEKVGSNGFSFDSGFRGGDFLFKSIKTGDYSLSNEGRNWWEAVYEQGYYYTYGCAYKGIIDCYRPYVHTPDTITKYENATRLTSRVNYQPVFKGIFNVKTVAGNIG